MDPCIYFNNDSSLIVAIYVDDLLIFWKDASVLDHLKKTLNTAFKMKDMGEAKVCLNINIEQSEGRIELDQSSYIKKVLQRFNVENCKPISIPSDPNQKLSISMSDDDVEQEKINSIPFQEALWLKQLANELAETDAFRPRTKHIDIKFHFVRKHIEDGIIDIKYIPTDEMVADNLTKAVTKDKHFFCSKFFGLKM